MGICKSAPIIPIRISSINEYFEEITAVNDESTLYKLILNNGLDVDMVFREACRQCTRKVILALLHESKSTLSMMSINIGLVYACTLGDMEILVLLCDNGAQVNSHHIKLARVGGYTQLVEYMLRTPGDIMTDEIAKYGLIHT